MLVENDPNPTISQQVIAALIALIAGMGAYIARLRVRVGKRHVSEEVMRAMARSAISQELLDSERWKSIDRRLDALELHRREDKEELSNSLDEIHRGLSALRRTR
jgi:hypothetical protein